MRGLLAVKVGEPVYNLSFGLCIASSLLPVVLLVWPLRSTGRRNGKKGPDPK
ncbi:MAG TPA: hypothetical protein PLL20_21455 [Phycisphaerae bacterium]|nr:hypothetical protein [Phycisphaerae bacterium]HRR86786.1 hypothetical protein [Phycisphaerae bacterium]